VVDRYLLQEKKRNYRERGRTSSFFQSDAGAEGVSAERNSGKNFEPKKISRGTSQGKYLN